MLLVTLAVLALVVPGAPEQAASGALGPLCSDVPAELVRAHDARVSQMLHGSAAAQAPNSPAGALRAMAAPESTSSARPMDYLWVVRTALVSPGDIDRVVASAREMGVRGVLVQVVGRGDAFYRSDLLPRAEALRAADRAHPDFDPLGELIERAHPLGLEVHAWINCMLVWSGPRAPRDPRHVVNAHPEWIARLRDGRRLSQLTLRQQKRLGLEGVFLAPAHPAVQAWVAGIACEIASRYAVDGIHLDYIRQPQVAVGFDPTTRARFALASGVDPARLAEVPAERRAAVDSAWEAFQREQVTAVVRGVRDSLALVRPGIVLSAAVLADTLAARSTHAQPWTEWVRDGLIEHAFAMCYAPIVQTVMDQLVGYATELGVNGRVVPGIAVYNTSPALAAAKILGARSLGFPLLALYSYDSLEQRSGYWSALLGRLTAAAGRP